MKQSDGSDLFGVHTSQSDAIGIVYVAPSDERQSVLSALWTQEKLGRKHIILVLPERNRAFQRAVDFDGLKQMRGDLQADLVIVAPRGSTPAELARQRNFEVYSNLESLAQTFRDEFTPTQEEPDSDEQPPQDLSPSPVAPVTSSPQPSPQPIVPPATPPLSPSPAGQPSDASSDLEPPVEEEIDDRVRLFPLSPSPAGAPAPSTDEPSDLPQPPAMPAPSTSLNPSSSRVTEEPAQPPLAPSAASTAAAPLNEAVTPAPDPAEPDVSPSPVPPSAPPVEPAPPPSRSPGSQPLPIVFNQPGSVVPAAPRPQMSGYPAIYTPPAPPRPRRRTWRSWLLVAVVALLLLALGFFLYTPVMNLLFAPTALVTITPDSQNVHKNYTLSAVLGPPDSSQNQVAARLLYTASQTQSLTAKATGQGQVPAKQANGILTFYNSLVTQQTIPAGTVIVGASGVPVVNDTAVILPPFDPATDTSGRATATAHAANVGASGNIPALDLNLTSCCGNGITVLNSDPFSGGQDAQTYTYVEQSDIDGAASTLQTTLTKNTLAALQKQVRANERLVEAPTCVPNVSSDFAAGQQATSVLVNVNVTCTGEVYDQQAVQSLASILLARDANISPGPAYVRLGAIRTTITHAAVDPKGNVSLLIAAQGIWVYQFNVTQRAALIHLIAGKNTLDAQHTLQRQAGVRKVSISFSSGEMDTLPSDQQRITLAVLGVSGLQG